MMQQYKSSRSIWLCFLLVMGLAGCQPKSVPYLITGNWESGENQMVYLKKDKQAKESIDSAMVKEGIFTLSGKMENIDKWALVVDKDISEILLDGEPIQVSVTKNRSFITVKITGSPEQVVLQAGRQLERTKGLIDLGSLFIMAGVKDDPVKLDSVWRETEEIKRQFDRSLREYLDTNRNSLSVTYLLSDFFAKNYPLEETVQYAEQLTPKVKDSYPGRRLAEKIAELRQVSAGGIAPDIALSTPDGDVLKLSSLRGKYVLLDFWASWCGPCLAEAPNVKEIYDKYHDKGFEVYAVSLDEKADLWKNAIANHGLNWLHVSSLQGWKCPTAIRYNVTGIPRMYLLDKEGRIVAMDLRGEKLKEKVASFFE